MEHPEMHPKYMKIDKYRDDSNFMEQLYSGLNFKSVPSSSMWATYSFDERRTGFNYFGLLKKIQEW